MSDQPLQNSLFEDDYLLRELGQVAHVPQVALTELVANAWDAGATRVDLVLPGEIGGTLTVTDNGHGMTPPQFNKRCMTRRYDRVKLQGSNVSSHPGGMFGHAAPTAATGSGGTACSALPTSTRCGPGARAFWPPSSSAPNLGPALSCCAVRLWDGRTGAAPASRYA